ncbi:hypothetical protein EYF80_057148 [Liparis tanakae]|uniref:Uncharacterized protein n=1 Tax=Liparis tanakae TaxID=230148 RepID=A0A4Z2EVL6_9TELE|nr:hypothetical protein EYF80_057148 [Liparis tanakae]
MAAAAAAADFRPHAFPPCVPNGASISRRWVQATVESDNGTQCGPRLRVGRS